MEIDTELRVKVEVYRKAMIGLDVARRGYDETRRALKETEQSLFYEATLDGRVDGKNAETRDAQALIVYRADAKWQNAVDAYRAKDEAYKTAQTDVTIAEMDLKVMVVLANLALGRMGVERLVTAVELPV
jgi:hypothetical protein